MSSNWATPLISNFDKQSQLHKQASSTQPWEPSKAEKGPARLEVSDGAADDDERLLSSV